MQIVGGRWSEATERRELGGGGREVEGSGGGEWWGSGQRDRGKGVGGRNPPILSVFGAGRGGSLVGGDRGQGWTGLRAWEE